MPRRGEVKAVTSFTGQRLIAKKPLRRFLRFTRGTDSLTPPYLDKPWDHGQTLT